MKKLSDEEIQRIVVDKLRYTNLTGSDAESLRAYRMLFDALEKKPADTLSLGFADKVVGQIGRRNSLIESVKFYFYMVFLISLFFTVALVTFLFAEVPFSREVINFIDDYKAGIIFGAVSLLVVQIMDELLVKKDFQNLAKSR